jgi:hypothetical protein
MINYGLLYFIRYKSSEGIIDRIVAPFILIDLWSSDFNSHYPVLSELLNIKKIAPSSDYYEDFVTK